MSGGHFEYKQFFCQDIADELRKMIAEGQVCPDSEYVIPPAILLKFEQAADLIEHTGNLIQAIDWFVSGDTGEESFLKEWEELQIAKAKTNDLESAV